MSLIERAIRERIVLVGVTVPPARVDDTESSLDELALLDRHRRRRGGRPRHAAQGSSRPGDVHRQGKDRGAARGLPRRRRRHGRVRQRAHARAAVQPGEAARAHRDRSHRGDPRHLRPERATPSKARPRSSSPCCATGCRGCDAVAPARCRSRRAASAPVVRARPSSRPIAAGCSDASRSSSTT